MTSQGIHPAQWCLLKWVLTLCMPFLLLHALLVQAEVPVPPLTSQVVDTTGTLTSQQQAELVEKLQAFEASKGSQLAVLMVQTTQPEAIEQYAIRVAEQWKIGRLKVDDGVILVVALQDRTVRIEVGYGLEGALPDITAKRIIENHILPEFKQGNIAGGVSEGVNRIMGVIEGEPLPAPAKQQTARSESRAGLGEIAPILFMLALFIGGGLRRALGKLPAAGLTGGVVFLVAWFMAGTVVVAFLAALAASFLTLSGVRMGGIGTGQGGLGRGGRGGFGGGFGGGGGGFGGGGASGRW